jgi:hypothetical protein
MPRTRVARQVSLYPRLECLGDGPQDADQSNCNWSEDPRRDWKPMVDQHLRARPTHEVLAIQETRTVYDRT